LLPIAQEIADNAGCHQILFTVPDRLGKTTEELSGIAALATSAAQQKASASSNLARVDYTFDGLDPWPEPDAPDMLSFFEQRFGVQNANLMFLGRANFSVVAVMIRSAKPDSVVNTISAEAKEAADQCSGTRPALVVVHLIDEISRFDLQTMLIVLVFVLSLALDRGGAGAGRVAVAGWSYRVIAVGAGAPQRVAYRNHHNLSLRAREGRAARRANGRNKAIASQSPLHKHLLYQESHSNERLRVSDWIVQRLYNDAVKETVEL
jgi:hypothetical protein